MTWRVRLGLATAKEAKAALRRITDGALFSLLSFQVDLGLV